MQYTIHNITLELLNQTHTLIAGTTGCGKSTLINSIIYTALVHGDKLLYLIDPKRTELKKYSKVKQCAFYADTDKKAVDCLNAVINEMNRRQRRMQRKGESFSSDCAVYVIIDELADLLVMSEYSKTIKSQIQKITQLARSANIRLIAATQQPNRKTLPAELQLNFTCRVGMACRQKTESRQIIGVDGCEMLPRPNQNSADQRRYMYVDDGINDINCYVVPYTTPETIAEVVKLRRRFLL